MANGYTVSAQIEAILDDYSKHVKTVSRRSVKSTARETAQRLRNTSSKRSGEYASGWTSRTIDEDTAVTYNRTKPSLTHLLENGHMIVNKKGQYGRVNGDHKIKDAEEWGSAELVNKIERSLE